MSPLTVKIGSVQCTAEQEAQSTNSKPWEADLPSCDQNLPWKVLGRALGFSTIDQQEYWLNTAPFFNSLLIQNGYDVHQQYQYLSFYHRHIIPVLGPFIRPAAEARYLSGFSIEGYSMELSVNYQASKATVRLGCEPVSHFAGTSTDPLNQTITREVLGNLALSVPTVDLRLFDYFDSQLSLTISEANSAAAHLIKPRRQSKVIAFDLKNGGIVPKAYFFLKPKSLATGKSVHDIAFRTIEPIAARQQIESPLSILKTFVAELFAKSTITSDVFIIAIDCILPEQSRIKLYVADVQLNLATMRHLWTLGGSVADPTTLRGLEIAEELWNILQVGGETRSHTDVDQLPLVVNYELSSSSATPTPQLYLPLHGRNDESVANALTKFWEYLGWKGVAARYKKELYANNPCRNLSESTKVQRWVAFSYTESAGVYLTVYFHAVGGIQGNLYE
ncbi:predicted protein [Aspergillus terreus NIH2624]|uniref:Uncharacterized protein n=1 Tax=Aspergillus terreus (strain NIH 2624 / FGSC A1156) TaxID=341663 RepID=Q0C7M8_ASPTN|nr:uncharacterized protein ATEG_10306 [Aspergillus terreus NIH2624]EAU29303.1 predicted protein [Aspergillus terreus NIH2624]